MTCAPEESKVIYRSKHGKEKKVFDALEWLAAIAIRSCQEIPFLEGIRRLW